MTLSLPPPKAKELESVVRSGVTSPTDGTEQDAESAATTHP